MTAISVCGSFTRPVDVAVAITRYSLLTMNSSGEVAHAGVAGTVIGVAEATVPTVASGRSGGDMIAVRSLNHDGVLRFIAGGVIAVGAEIQPGADGVVVTGEGLGYVNQTTGVVSGDIIEASPLSVGAGAQAATAVATTGVQLADGSQHVTITSAGLTDIVVLPTATPGVVVTGYVGANGCDLSSLGAGVKINDVIAVVATAGASIPATSMFTATCVAADAWLLEVVSELGAVVTAIVPA